MSETTTDWTTRLAAAVARGEILDLAPGIAIDVAVMSQWDEGRSIPAAAIRDALRTLTRGSADARGLRIRGARIEGTLDLENIEAGFAVVLEACHLPSGLVARGA